MRLDCVNLAVDIRETLAEVNSMIDQLREEIKAENPDVNPMFIRDTRGNLRMMPLYQMKTDLLKSLAVLEAT